MFDTHKLNDNGFQKMQKYKQAMADATRMACALMDASPEMNNSARKKVFLEHMETAIFYGAKAIAAIPANHTEVVSY